MKNLFLTLTACAAAFSGCKVYYGMIRAENLYYTSEQQEMLEKTTAAAGYGYGYDENVDLNYVFYKDQDNVHSEAQYNNELRQVFVQAGEKKSTDFFERMLYLRELTKSTMNYYESKESWKEYTNINKYLLPALEDCLAVLQKNFLASYPAYASSVESKKKAFAEETAKIMDKNKYTNIWETVR